MISKEIHIPFFAKATIFFVGVIALAAILYIGKSIIVPVVFATILAIVLQPIVKFMVHMKINRVLAIIITMLLTILALFGFISLLVSQVSHFSDTWPVLSEKITGTLEEGIAWISYRFDLDPQKIHDWLDTAISEITNISTAAIGQTMVIFGSVVIVLFLIPVYIFLILYYLPILREFFRKLFGEEQQDQVNKIATKTKSVIQSYLVGLLIEAGLVAVMDIAVLLILGIDYAILLGILGAVLNVIPYIGGVIAVALPMMVALATKSTAMYAVYVLVGYYIIQLIDNNYIVPKIVSSKVKINALFSIIVVFVGNALWGVPGMFLSIPLLAIVKVFFDHFESLKPWGFLLGDTMPSLLKIPPILKIIKKVKK